MTRSYLFVPGDSEKKLQKAADSRADALIIDLEDSVDAGSREGARGLAAEFLATRGDRPAWVRINPLDSPDSPKDLLAVVAAGPAGIVLPKARGVADVAALAASLDRLEQQHGLPSGEIEILPIATERPDALFRLQEYSGSIPRLAGLTWGAEDLSAALGATAVRDADGNWLSPYLLARSLCLFAAAAAGVAAVDTVYTDFRDLAGLGKFAAAGRRDGFSGMLAIHPAQIEPINAAFEPTAAEIERARRIVELFASHPGVGTIGMDGQMLDRPHWLRARKLLELADRSKVGA